MKIAIPVALRRLVDPDYRLVSSEFDAQFYLASSSDSQLNGADPFAHFMTVGWKEGRNPTSWFDIKAYLLRNPDVGQSGMNPFLHYLKFGRAEQRPLQFQEPKPDVATRSMWGDRLDELGAAGVLDVKAYQQATGAGPFATASDAFSHAMSRGFVPLEVINGDPTNLLFVLGNECRSKRMLVQAQGFYHLVAEFKPGHFQALQHLADCCVDQHNFPAAAYFYRLALEVNDQYFWTHANLAKCLFEMARYDEAIRHAHIAHALEPGLVYAQKQLESLAHTRGMQLIHSGIAAAVARDVSGSRQKMHAALAIGPARLRPQDVPPGTWQQSNPKTVVILADDTLPQCLLYRVKNKVFQLRTQDVQTQWFPKSDINGFKDALPFADAAIFYRVPAFPEIVDTIRYARAIGRPTFYDIDDLIFEGEHYPEPFESYANLISREQYGGLVGGSELFRLAMRECDYGLASTAPLAEFMAKEVLSGDVVIIPNSLGQLHLAELDIPAERRSRSKKSVRLFYGSGTLAHKQDFAVFANDVLAPLLTKHKNLELVLVGTFPLLPSLQPHHLRVHQLATDWTFERYLRQLRTADINLAILAPGTFNDCKSEIKWLEAAMFGVPSVLSRTRTHELTVEHGKTGFLCETNDEWFSALDQLIGDEDLRREMGAAAQEVVRAEYGASEIGARLAQAIESRATQPAPTPRDRLRVAVVNVFYPPQAIGGATRVVHENVASLHRRYGHEIEVCVFTSTEGGIRAGEVSEYHIDGVRVVAVTPKTAPNFEWNPRDPEIEKVFARFLDRFKPDVVHFHCLQRLTGSVVEATRRAGIPYFVTVHDGWWLSDHQFMVNQAGEVLTPQALTVAAMEASDVPAASIERTRYLRDLLAGAEAVLAVSEPFGELYREAGVTNVRTVENGTTIMPPVARDPLAGERVRVGLIGGLAAHKGFNLVQEVWATTRFSNLELVLVDHRYSEFMQDSTSWNGNPVTIVGRVAQSRVASLYASLDVLLAVSIWPESYGLVTREAAQAGLWIVASDRGSIGDVVENGKNGFCIDVSDASELQRVMSDIDATPEKYRTRTGYPLSLRTFDEQTDELVVLYREVKAGAPIEAAERAVPQVAAG